MTRQQTPTLTETIQALIQNELSDIHTAIPAEIVSYNYEKNLATVKPTLKRKYKNKLEPIELPLIVNVPVCFSSMGPAHLRFPIKEKMTGMIIFSERSIDKWLVNGTILDPEDARKFSLSDATFWPGLRPHSDQIKSLAAQDSLELKLNGSYLEILSNGKFKIKGTNEELFDLLVQTLEKLISMATELGENDTTNTIFGPMQPNNFTAYQALKNDFNNLKSKMETLKG